MSYFLSKIIFRKNCHKTNDSKILAIAEALKT